MHIEFIIQPFRLRGLVNAGKVDTSVSDDVAERFRIDDSQCPTFLLYEFNQIIIK